MSKREIDQEIQKKNYDRELLLCKKVGGDVEKYRRLSFDVLQLEQIRKGLENGVDVERYLDPRKSWLEMEEMRISMETGFDMEGYIRQGFDWMQCNEIREGIQAGVDVKQYMDVHYLAPQMKEIRKGLEQGVDVRCYADPRFDWFQMREIRKGLEDKLDVSLYAKVAYKHTTMRAVRKGLAKGIDLVSYAEKGYTGKELGEISRGISMNHDIIQYLEQGYDAEQLHEINNAHEQGVNLLPYLKKEFHGVQLQEIIAGLKEGLDVSQYADTQLNWFQMREIRYGLESHIDVMAYAQASFSQKQMELIRKGLLEGVDVSRYAQVYYDPEQMEEILQELEREGEELTEEMEELLRNTMEEELPIEEIESGEITDDFVLDSCVIVSKDKMQATINFSVVKDVMKETLERFKVQDVIKLLKHHDVRQGIMREKIFSMLEEKRYDEDVVVAEGKAAVDGRDGSFEYHFRKELNRKPRVLEDGSVDYKSMDLFESVKKDALIAEYRPATTGTFGYDITGHILTPQRGKELPPLKGTGFMMTADKKQYFSLIDGIIELNEDDNRMEIRKLYTVPGDVDASVGNIQFNGDVNVMGNVQYGFSISATGSIVIDGHCEASLIEAGGDVVIRKGCQGKMIGKIVAGGEITGQFFESVKLRAEKNIQASYLLNCDLRTEGSLMVEGRKGVIIGGCVCAKKGVSCYGIGNIAEIKTIVEVGIDKEDMASYQDLLKQIDKIEAELLTCEAALDKIMQQSVRDDKVTAMVHRLTKAIYTQKTQKKNLIQEREQRMEKMSKQKEARIRVLGTVYPGTLLYLNADPFVVRQSYTNVDFVKQENKIDTVTR